ASSDLKYWEALFLKSSDSNGLLSFIDLDSPRYPYRFYKPALAPTPPPEFGKSLGGNGSDGCRAVTVDALGNSYVWGDFAGFMNLGGGGMSAYPGKDLFLANYDSSGTFLMQRRFGYTGVETPRAATLNTSGNLFIAGSFTGTTDLRENAANPNSCNCGAAFFDTTLISSGSQDIFLARYNSLAAFSPCAGNTNGACVWARSFGGTGFDIANSITTDIQGNVYMAGSFAGSVDFGSGTPLIAQAGTNDSFLAKYGPDGQYLWARNFSNSGDDEAVRVAASPDGSVMVAGTYNGTHQLAPVSIDATCSSFYIARISAGSSGVPGSVIWSRNASFSPGISNAVARATALSVDGAGNAYVAGYLHTGTNSLGMVLGNNLGLGDATSTTAAIVPHNTPPLTPDNPFLAKYSPNGACLWVKLMEAPLSGKILASCMDSMGFLNVTGTFQDWLAVDGVTVTNSNPRFDAAFVSRFSQGGHLQWTRVYGGTDNVTPADIAANPGGGLVLVGSYRGTATLGPLTTSSANNSIDGFMIQINPNGN
ncbi:MAG TPA: SBBP repeat-containing protein, partial [Candidatus Dormibacteraeota bacterium]|nr:SBBP repeat-containing protein [Candidatus Dormibacteraeota bacterium]